MRYFICNIVPREHLVNYHVPTAAFNFCEGLIKSSIFDKAYSILPLNVCDYKETLINLDFEIVYSRLRRLKLFKIIAVLTEQIIVFIKIKRGADVWFYNSSILNSFLFVLLRLFKRSVRIYTIVLDYTPNGESDSHFLPFINHSNGLIKLADSHLFTVKNSVCLPGVVIDTINADEVIVGDSFNFLLSGNIKEEIAMTSKLLEVFSKIPIAHLYISGHAQNPELIRKYAETYNNIHYYGMVDYDEFLNLLKKCPFLLSTRDPEEPRNQCNFPSKIMEGLLYNKIVISTIKYPQLDGINYFIVPSETTELQKSIEAITKLSPDALARYANQSAKVKNMFNANVWKTHITNIENHGRN